MCFSPQFSFLAYVFHIVTFQRNIFQFTEGLILCLVLIRKLEGDFIEHEAFFGSSGVTSDKRSDYFSVRKVLTEVVFFLDCLSKFTASLSF